MDFILSKFNYWIYIILMMIGLYAMISKNNLIKKMIGMSIFQTAIILFYVSIGVKTGATIPIIQHHAAHNAEQAVRLAQFPIMPLAQAKSESHKKEHLKPTLSKEPGKKVESQGKGHAEHHQIQVKDYNNPLPHVLMLTAIVVGVATLGVGLAIVQKIYIEYGSVEESEILDLIKQETL